MVYITGGLLVLSLLEEQQTLLSLVINTGLNVFHTVKSYQTEPPQDLDFFTLP
jgi:hypothetical protein